MRVVQMNGYGGPEVLATADVPAPDAAAGQIRIAIRAVGVNPADHKWRQGMFRAFAPVGLPHVLGYDVAGTIDQVGTGVRGFRSGDRVFAMLNNLHKGGYAEQAVIPASEAAHMPDGLDFAAAAALATPGLTGSQMIDDHARPTPGQTILITGAIGAVGRSATYAARKAGARVIAAVRASQTADARSLGAEAVIALGEDVWSGRPFDHVVDTVGGPAVAALCRHLAPGGTIHTAATTAIDPAGLAVEPRFIMVHADAARLEALARAVVADELTIPVALRLPLDSAAEAHRLMERGGVGGRIILEPGASTNGRGDDVPGLA